MRLRLKSGLHGACAYKTDLLLLGEYIEGLDFPICNKFTPTVLDGQLCYTLDLGSALPNIETFDGNRGGLVLLLDYNTERSIKPKEPAQEETNNSKRFIIVGDIAGENDNKAKIFIHTLKSHYGFGGASYVMSSLKKTTPTEDFLKLPLSRRGCADKDQQECLMKTYLDQKLQNCGCVPWEITNWTKVNLK